jgi:lipopolysaccharide export system permease protein
MKRLDGYVAGSVALTATVALVLVIVVMMLFDAFSNLERYLSMDVPVGLIARLTLLQAPQGVVLGLGPSLLFSVTYVLSMLQANNELIVLYNAGFPYRRIIMPCLALAVLSVGFQFAFNEQVAIGAAREKTLLTNELLGVRNAYDNRNVTLRSPDGSYVLYAGRYYEETGRLAQVTVVVLDRQGALAARIDAPSAQYNGSFWELANATRYLVDTEGNAVTATRETIYRNERIDLEPGLFRNLTADIKTMGLQDAVAYVKRLRVIDPQRYASYATDLQERVWANLTPLILTVISCSTLLGWKKNVLVFSIISSLSIAVVFFVIKMLATIMSKQMIIGPVAGAAIPVLAMVSLAVLSILIRRK